MRYRPQEKVALHDGTIGVIHAIDPVEIIFDDEFDYIVKDANGELWFVDNSDIAGRIH